jgi:hypothetical protein
MALKLGHLARYINNTWKVLKRSAGEGETSITKRNIPPAICNSVTEGKIEIMIEVTGRQ